MVFWTDEHGFPRDTPRCQRVEPSFHDGEPVLLVGETSLHGVEHGSLAVEGVPLRHGRELLGVQAALHGHRFDSLREEPAPQLGQGASLAEGSGFDAYPSSPPRPGFRSHAMGSAILASSVTYFASRSCSAFISAVASFSPTSS
jgi:hypothetical protein